MKRHQILWQLVPIGVCLLAALTVVGSTWACSCCINPRSSHSFSDAWATCVFGSKTKCQLPLQDTHVIGIGRDKTHQAPVCLCGLQLMPMGSSFLYSFPLSICFPFLPVAPQTEGQTPDRKTMVLQRLPNPFPWWYEVNSCNTQYLYNKEYVEWFCVSHQTLTYLLIPSFFYLPICTLDVLILSAIGFSSLLMPFEL